MCGRKALEKGKEEIIEELMADKWSAGDFMPNYNIAPTQNSLVLVKEKQSNIIKSMRWGLLNEWTNNLSDGSKIINARSETIAQKPSFKGLLSRNRCIVISDGYYEWKKHQNKKIPFFIQRKDRYLMLLAGLWRIWQSPSNYIYTYTILTKRAQRDISHIHNRMPVILSKSEIEKWINPNNSYSKIEKNIINDVQDLDYYEVSNFVNSTKNNSIKCITPFKTNVGLKLFNDN